LDIAALVALADLLPRDFASQRGRIAAAKAREAEHRQSQRTRPDHKHASAE
jgi:hypothetical protein